MTPPFLSAWVCIGWRRQLLAYSSAVERHSVKVLVVGSIPTMLEVYGNLGTEIIKNGKNRILYWIIE